MNILINYEAVFQSVTDIWLPILIPFGILTLVFILIAVLRREKGDNQDKKNERKKK